MGTRRELRAKRRVMRERDNKTMSSIRSILNNPAAAKEAYPNPQIRANIIPFMRSLRRQADRAERIRKKKKK